MLSLKRLKIYENEIMRVYCSKSQASKYVTGTQKLEKVGRLVNMYQNAFSDLDDKTKGDLKKTQPDCLICVMNQRRARGQGVV